MATWNPTMKGHIRKLSLIFTILAVLVFFKLISNITTLEDLNVQLISTFYKVRNTIHSAFNPPEILLPFDINHTTCAQFGQKSTADEAKEEKCLLDYISWPGPLEHGLPLELSSNPSKSYFVIQGPPVNASFHIGDQLVVNVHMRNFLGQPKKHGGDFLIARLHSPELGAGVAGKVHDHQNGNYTVLFPLLWAGVVHVQITMVHPSEAVVVLKRLQPDRVFFNSVFRSGTISEATVCNLCLPLNEKPLCNYTDCETGEPWYCYKPQNLNCDTRIDHSIVGYKKNIITEYEAQFFQSMLNIKVPIPASVLDSVTVLPAEGQTKIKRMNNTAGYYFDNTWNPLNGAVIHQFTSVAITQCLKGKAVYMFGDSTIRQWFEYLTDFLPDLKQLNLYSSKQLGPFMAVDSNNNILVTFRGHGPPIRTTSVFASGLRYVANELDRLRGGPNTVVLVSVWAHFSTFPPEVYIRRLRNIRRAVIRLLDREPATVVVIRTANLQKMAPESSLFNSDWFSVQIDAVLRAMFRGIRVLWLDAWEMTLAHHLPHDIHPSRPIIKNMIDLILSQICPKDKI